MKSDKNLFKELRKKITAKSKQMLADLTDIGHLSGETITAFVDSELSAGAQRRVAQHVNKCHSCCEEMLDQESIKNTMDTNKTKMCISETLLNSLRNIINK